MQRLQFGLSFLATVGATAPFVGLFGTVWGIMHSFTGIAAAKDTSLAVVAPGIAEALFATAVGLAAAIPAVIFYNQANVLLGSVAARMTAAVTKYAKLRVYGHVQGGMLEAAAPSASSLENAHLRFVLRMPIVNLFTKRWIRRSLAAGA